MGWRTIFFLHLESKSKGESLRLLGGRALGHIQLTSKHKKGEDDDGDLDHNVDDWTRLCGLEEMEEPIETIVVTVHPDQLQSDHIVGTV